MNSAVSKEAPRSLVILAFAVVYIVWGSTYFFIQKALEGGVSAFVMGAIRFLISGLIILAWCIYKKEKLWNRKQLKAAFITGLLLLFIGNGAVIVAEKNIASSLVAVLVSSAPLWFVLLDKPKWKENFTCRDTIIGLIVGFAGVILLFSEKVAEVFRSGSGTVQLGALFLLIIGSVSWAGGSLYSKYKSNGSAIVNTTWQMLAASAAFSVSGLINGEWQSFQPATVTTSGWLAIVYLVLMGSLAGYSAYVWLLQVRPATQVSTYAYVNPVVAVLLGVFFAGEKITLIQLAGLAIILISVLLINLAKGRREKTVSKIPDTMAAEAA